MIMLNLLVVADENGTAIFSETKPITYAEACRRIYIDLQADYDDNEQYQRNRASEVPCR
jgi:hypothetical protein